MNEPETDVTIDHLLVHGPLNASRADYIAGIQAEVARTLDEHGLDGLRAGRLQADRVLGAGNGRRRSPRPDPRPVDSGDVSRRSS